ncbi:MAG: hypothetical protein GC159_08905 [Phycisphaera sp.]|nr:hypothetical protein [Phycisphaera sp.]
MSQELLRAYQELLRSPILRIAKDIPEVMPSLQHLAEGANPPITTFVDMVRHPQPPLKLLEVVKYFAKRDYHVAKKMPEQVALTLYYLTIVQAYLVYDEKLTAMSFEQLKAGIASRLTQLWLDAGSRAVFAAALESMELILQSTEDPEASAFPANFRYSGD